MVRIVETYAKDVIAVGDRARFEHQAQPLLNRNQAYLIQMSSETGRLNLKLIEKPSWVGYSQEVNV